MHIAASTAIQELLNAEIPHSVNAREKSIVLSRCFVAVHLDNVDSWFKHITTTTSTTATHTHTHIAPEMNGRVWGRVREKKHSNNNIINNNISLQKNPRLFRFDVMKWNPIYAHAVFRKNIHKTIWFDRAEWVRVCVHEYPWCFFIIFIHGVARCYFFFKQIMPVYRAKIVIELCLHFFRSFFFSMFLCSTVFGLMISDMQTKKRGRTDATVSERDFIK